MEFLITITSVAATGLITWLITNKQIKAAYENSIKQVELEKKQHISNTRFEREFAIYQELNDKFATMTRMAVNLFPNMIIYEPLNSEERLSFRKNLYNDASNAHSDACFAITKHAAFIPIAIYEKYSNIIQLCQKQLQLFYDFKLDGIPKELIMELKSERAECSTNTIKIHDSMIELADYLREYLEKLEKTEK